MGIIFDILNGFKMVKLYSKVSLQYSSMISSMKIYLMLSVLDRGDQSLLVL